MKYILFLLWIKSTIFSSSIIDNDLTINNLSIDGFLNVRGDSNLNTVYCNGNTINLNSNCFFNTMFLNGLDQIVSIEDSYYYLMLDNNNIFVSNYVILNNDTIYVNNIFGLSNTIGINTKENTGDIYFLNNVNCNSVFTINYNINTIDSIMTISESKCTNINAIGKSTENTPIFILNIDKSLYIKSPSIIINDIDNDGVLGLNQINGQYSFYGRVLFLDMPVTNYNPNILFITSDQNNNITKNILDINNYQKSSFNTLYGNNNLNITNNQKIELNSSGGLTFKELVSYTDSLKVNAPNYVYFNINNINVRGPNSSITCTELNINQDTIQFDNITGSNIAGNAQFIMNGKNLIYDRGDTTQTYHSILKWNPHAGSGLQLVLDENNELFTLPPSSKRFMENIMPLEINEEKFQSIFDLSDTNEDFNIKKLIGTSLESMIRYDENQEPLMYEERDLLAVYFTQLPHIDKKIESLKNEINFIKSYLEDSRLN